MRRGWVGVALLLLLVLGAAFTVTAQVPTASFTGSFSTTSTTIWYPLTGQSSCAIVLTGSGTGMTIVPQGASDQPPTVAVTIASINSGSMSSNGTYFGSVGNYALTGIRLNVTAFTGGVENYTITCSAAAPPSLVTGSITAQISPIPLPVTVPTIAPGLAAPVGILCPSTAPAPTNGGYSCTISSTGVLQVNTPAPIPTISPGLFPGHVLACPSAAPGAINGAYTCTISSTGVLQVNTPAPAPTLSPGLVVGVTLACPSTSPANVNGAYICTADSSGRLQVSTPVPATHLSTSNPTSAPVAVKASAGTLQMVRFYNGSASTQFIGIYDLAVGSVTLGTTVATEVLQCPATTYCFLPLNTPGLTFTTAITYLCGTALTAGAVGTACGSNTSSFLMFDYQYGGQGTFGLAHYDRHLRVMPHHGLFDP